MPLRTRSLPSTDELAHLRGLSAFLPVNILHTMGERSASTIAIERNGEPGDAQHNGGFIRFSSHETTWRTSAASEGRRQPEQGKDLRPEWSKSWAEPVLATGVLTFKLLSVEFG